MILFVSCAIPALLLIELLWRWVHCKVRLVTDSCRAFEMSRRKP
jgi:hypothetical protein